MGVRDMEESEQSTRSVPAQMLGLSFELWHLTAESQAVIAMRLMGMGGLWRVSPDEHRRMVIEKSFGFAEAGTAAVAAASTGKRPDQVVLAAVSPLRERTASNAKRLGAAGWRYWA